MEPKIFTREALLIAGVTGSGDETGKAWDAFMKLDKLNPLKNRITDDGYEIRLYSGEGAGEVHVGACVKDVHVPVEYKVISLPSSLYAEFEIYPSKGYTSGNAEMNKWLSDNASVYRQGRLDDKYFAVEVYDNRYKGEKDPTSVVGIMVPIVPID
ncbi:MAG TPA: GyrI-like domain-containing protein [Dehalococcoidia bacterium]|nr:GyrI-like domain-containing protein [Dehalococcoidia bacterium]